MKIEKLEANFEFAKTLDSDLILGIDYDTSKEREIVIVPNANLDDKLKYIKKNNINVASAEPFNINKFIRDKAEDNNAERFTQKIVTFEEVREDFELEHLEDFVRRLVEFFVESGEDNFLIKDFSIEWNNKKEIKGMHYTFGVETLWDSAKEMLISANVYPDVLSDKVIGKNGPITVYGESFLSRIEKDLEKLKEEALWSVLNAGQQQKLQAIEKLKHGLEEGESVFNVLKDFPHMKSKEES